MRKTVNKPIISYILYHWCLYKTTESWLLYSRISHKLLLIPSPFHRKARLRQAPLGVNDGGLHIACRLQVLQLTHSTHQQIVDKMSYTKRELQQPAPPPGPGINRKWLAKYGYLTNIKSTH